MPLRKGHTLVVPKVHYSRLSDLPPEYAAAIGEAVSKVAHALTQALGNAALNVVCNQESTIISYRPRAMSRRRRHPPSKIELSKDKGPPLTRREMHRMEFEGREELDDEDGVALVKLIRARL